jgi:hypothetical protein
MMDQWTGLFFGSALTAIMLGQIRRRRKDEEAQEMVEYSGSCHCKKVTFRVTAPAHMIVWNCNCSVCDMKRNLHFIVPKSRFTLLTGKDDLQLYTFNTHTAQHMFCKHCGVQSFYVSYYFYIYISCWKYFFRFLALILMDMVWPFIALINPR